MIALLILFAAAPSDAQLSGAVRVLVANWHSQESSDLVLAVGASDLVDLMQQLGVDPSTEPALQRQAECLRDATSGRVPRTCDDLRASNRPTRPTDAELAQALATLGKARGPRLSDETLARVITEVLGFTSLRYARVEDERALATLLARIKAAGSDLMPLFQAQLDAIEQESCETMREAVVERLSELNIEAMQNPPPVGTHRVASVPNYVIERRVATADGYAVFIARGSGPMKGDVLTTEQGYPTLKTDGCGKKRAPPLGAPRPARRAINPR